jgi:hypothetical protein
LCLLLVINDDSYWEKYKDHFKFNWEFPGYQKGDAAKGVMFFHLHDEIETVFDYIRPGYMIPIGAMAVNQGIRVLQILKEKREVTFDVPNLVS